jgi:hypothetical protein
MIESVDSPATTLKELDDINPKALADSLALALSEQVGGDFRVSLTKLEQTHPGCGDNKLVLHFHVKDESFILRIMERSHRVDGVTTL